VLVGTKALSQFGVPESTNAVHPDPNYLAQHSEIQIETLSADGNFEPENAHSVGALSEVLKALLPADALARAKSEAKGVVAPFLKVSLEQSPMARLLAQKIYSQDLWSLQELSSELWGESTATTQQATILLLRLAAAARSHPDAAPLIHTVSIVWFVQPKGFPCASVKAAPRVLNHRQVAWEPSRPRWIAVSSATRSPFPSFGVRPVGNGPWLATKIRTPEKWSRVFLLMP
jgi:hypothetical protein